MAQYLNDTRNHRQRHFYDLSDGVYDCLDRQIFRTDVSIDTDPFGLLFFPHNYKNKKNLSKP